MRQMTKTKSNVLWTVIWPLFKFHNKTVKNKITINVKKHLSV